MRRIWLFSANKIKSSESFSKQPTQLIVELNWALRHIIVTLNLFGFTSAYLWNSPLHHNILCCCQDTTGKWEESHPKLWISHCWSVQLEKMVPLFYKTLCIIFFIRLNLEITEKNEKSGIHTFSKKIYLHVCIQTDEIGINGGSMRAFNSSA